MLLKDAIYVEQLLDAAQKKIEQVEEGPSTRRALEAVLEAVRVLFDRLENSDNA